jgi:hypothetical protein
MRYRFLWLLAALSLSARAAELKFDFGDFSVNQTPRGFRSALLGQGKPGDWKVVMDEVPPLLAPLTSKAPVVTRRAVLAQLSQDPTDERFPLLIYDGDTFGDFTLTTKFKLVGGELEQMAGVAFRIQNETNFYVIRVSARNNIRFYKVVNGQRGDLIGPSVEIPKGVWHELSVECKGNQIRCRLNGKEAIPALTDNTFARGKIGFWTKSDSISYFTDTKLTYTPRELLAQAIVRDTVKKYSRLVELKIYVLNDRGEPRLIASKTESEVGGIGGDAEKNVIAHDAIYYGKDKDTVAVIMPLRDRNGESIAAVRVVMKSFAGQTEQSALVRAMPIVKEMQARVQTLQELAQ